MQHGAPALSLALTLISGMLAHEPDSTLRMPDADMQVTDCIVDEIWSASTEQTPEITVNGSDPDNAADRSRTWRALRDGAHLHALIDPKDEKLPKHHSSFNSSWQDDSVESYVDGGNSKGDLQAFSNQKVNLANINAITIGFGRKNATFPAVQALCTLKICC